MDESPDAKLDRGWLFIQRITVKALVMDIAECSDWKPLHLAQQSMAKW